MQLANQEAQRLNHEYIGTEHILLGLIKEGEGVAANVLKNLDVDLRKVRLEIEKIVQIGPSPERVILGKLPHTPRSKKVIEYSVEEARRLNHNYIGTEHLLLGLLREQEGVAAQVLLNLRLKLDDVREEVLNLLGHNADDRSALNDPTKYGANSTSEFHEPARRSRTPELCGLGHDLTDLARKDVLRPLIGRQAELMALCEVLACRSRKNPLLLGEPGVGKRTLVAGLARAIAEGRAPEWLRNCRVFLLPISDLWADGIGTSAVAERARAIFHGDRRPRDAVLFLPDAIASLGALAPGPASERVHVQLLSALWTDQLQCVFTATPAEYQRCLKVRPALAGTVQEIVLRPTTIGETVAILSGIRERYEIHHKATIADLAITAAAEAADCHLQGVLPGKAVVLLDRACARSRSKAGILAPELAAVIQDLDMQMERLNAEKEEAVAAQDFPRAVELRDRADALKEEKERRLRERPERSAQETIVDAAVVAEVLRDMAGDVPASEP
jgi:ATP-dependent Clp protease ATP-binding subunit ClpC